MSKTQGTVDIEQSGLHCEIAGAGTPFLMIHAGITDSQQWEREFSYFSGDYQVIRYDMRGYGKSKWVGGPFSHLEDLTALVRDLDVRPPIILMGCSMGGMLALEYAINNPQEIKALLLLGPGLCGLELDVAEPEEFSAAKIAFEEGDLNLLAEIETQIWFDSQDQDPEHADCSMRALLYEMQHSLKSRNVRRKGTGKSEEKDAVVDCLDKVDFPVLIVVGSYDLSYMHAAADYLLDHVHSARKEIIEDAAHLPNLDQPQRCLEVVDSFLEELTKGKEYDQMLP